MKGEVIIKVGFCVAYDWHLLKTSLPRVYKHADSICLSIDKNRKSWSGKPYTFDNEEFKEWFNAIDIERKISLFEEDFSLPGLTAIENDNRQRTMMSDFMGKGGWHIQIDSDEYFFDFKGFKEYLIKQTKNPTGNEKPINICCNWVSVFKKIEQGYLVVDNRDAHWETMPFATNKPEYLNARRNSHFNHISPSFVLHETWARSEEGLKQKLDSWGHEGDFLNKDEYFNFWKSLDENNYINATNFHPLKPVVWHKLKFIKAIDINNLISQIECDQKFSVNQIELSFLNSRILQGLISRIKNFLNRML